MNAILSVKRKKNNMTSSEEKKLARQYVRSPIPRFRWTDDLHQSFLRAIDYLGGEQKATPKLILELMGVNGLTVSHVKSHLQMHRNNKRYENSQEVKSRCSHLQRSENSKGRFRPKYGNSPISRLNKKSHKYISMYSHKRLIRASEVPPSLEDEKDAQRVTSSQQNETIDSYVHCTNNSISALLTSTHQNAHENIWNNIRLSQAWPENNKHCKHSDLDSMLMSMYSKDGGGEPSQHGEFSSSMACRSHSNQENKDSQEALVLNDIQLANDIDKKDESKGQGSDNVKLNQKPLIVEDDIQLELSL